MKSMTLRRAFITGAIGGMSASVILITSGFLEVFFTPRWQELLFYPGLVAGWAFYNCCRGWFAASIDAENVAMILGVLTVGLYYGLVAMALFALIGRFAAHRRI